MNCEDLTILIAAIAILFLAVLWSGETPRQAELPQPVEYRCESKQIFFVQRGDYEPHRFRVLVEQQ